jgi:hypothetical protein
MKALLALALLASTLCAVGADSPKADAKKPDPIIGKWRWSYKNLVIDLLADGTAQGPGEVGKGVWKPVPTTNVERRYLLTWREGNGVDALTLSQDGKKLTGKSQTSGLKFTADRVE